ncbi:DinB family protein [Nocardioides ferulae]|uniref:DinB family protein n=1 Tax=Nocardioides ferulae TaxID=2340821 RepID=UPI001F0B7E98|nr:DinB family protein [Nocardioides ferulae]
MDRQATSPDDGMFPGGGGPAWTVDLRARFDGLLDEHRAMMDASLEGLTEEEARRSLVPSRTTLLGLVKHVTYVEQVWFNQALTGRSLKEIGAPATPDRSFVLHKSDTIASVRAAYAAACADSRPLVSDLPLDAEVTGRGPRPLWAIYAHMLRELAQHCGHADILREQVLAARP